MSSQVERIIEKHIQNGGFAGAAVVAIGGGKIVAEHYAGDAAPGLASGPRVLWPIASISKVYTATMIMRLVEQGALTLSTPVCEILPDFRGGGREEMRLRHLLTHTSGMIYESPEMADRLKAQTPLRTLIEEACNSPLLFTPGTAFKYADYNYLLVGHVAEVATGRPYSELVRALLLDPAELNETFIPPRREDDLRMARIRGVLAEGTDGAMYNSRYTRELAHPAFGVFATVRDLARFGALFAPSGPHLLSAVVIRAMTTDQTGGVPGVHPSMKGYGADVRIPWAIGFALQTEKVPSLYSDLASFRTFGHGGASGCELVIDPTLDLVVAVVSNTHLSTGRERWYMRMQSIINCVFAEFARVPIPEMAEA
jgi:CubicO group peptidase (beta-lactamase class C family)